jgi:medium-chain acyl-[acyl-carrier-protein] hydrolase
MSPDAWLPFGPPTQGAAVRLFCFPFAGGGASVYRAWRQTAPAGLDVLPVQLPGREGRIREAPYRSAGPLAEALAGALASHMSRPYALFGHSMGALIAFELAGRLRKKGLPAPRLLVASASRAPHRTKRADPIHCLPDAAFRDALRDLEGTPEAVLAHDELMELLLPTLRADFELCEKYVHDGNDPLGCPILTIGGTSDPNVTAAELGDWRAMTRGVYTEHILQGGHFFLEEHAAGILALVSETVLGGEMPAGDPRT